jgi:hypothetical protein
MDGDGDGWIVKELSWIRAVAANPRRQGGAWRRHRAQPRPGGVNSTMTVVSEDRLMTLICDTCGESTTGLACVLPDAEVVWTLVTDLGWSGSPFASGPHRCPHCSLLPGTDERAGCEAHGPGGVLGIDHVEDVTVVTPTGDVDLDTGDTLRAALRHAADMGGDVVVDLSQVHRELAWGVPGVTDVCNALRLASRQGPRR